MLRVQGQLQAENLRHHMQRDQASGSTSRVSSFSALPGEQPVVWPHCLHVIGLPRDDVDAAAMHDVSITASSCHIAYLQVCPAPEPSAVEPWAGFPPIKRGLYSASCRLPHPGK